jgi:hypothetical protein
MKTIPVLGLLAGIAIVAPVAAAHIVIYVDPVFGTGGTNCNDTWPETIGAPGSLPHAWIGVTNCPYDHTNTSPTEILP